MKTISTWLTFLFSSIYVFHSIGQKILEVGPGKTFSNPQLALQQAKPGDTVLMYPAIYPGDYFIQNLKGTRSARITLKGLDATQVIFEGSQAFQFSEIEFVNLQDFSIRGQSANGLNLDDGGTYESPSKNVLLSNIRFLRMNATGNNDMLKLSGLDSFEIIHCDFSNGSPGGSGIDMVGCHHGIIHQSTFRNQGNSIQSKGGSRFLRIEQNEFINGGDRALNLGGSTGSAFFRPLGINYEAADILVASNKFVGSQSPIAFVGCRRVLVSNNTFYNPTKWIFRILQESPDTSFYLSCANNVFCNNIIYGFSVDPTINIGPNTSEKTFKIQNNLWFSERNNSWRGPSLPVPESNGIYALNPLLTDIANGDVRPTVNSPAIGKGLFQGEINSDYYQLNFKNPPSIGCAEFTNTLKVDHYKPSEIYIYPNPAKDNIYLHIPYSDTRVEIINLYNQVVYSGSPIHNHLDITTYPAGIYWLKLFSCDLQVGYLQFLKQ